MNRFILLPHNEIGGIVGRGIVFMSGLLPLILYATGFIRWRQKKFYLS